MSEENGDGCYHYPNEVPGSSKYKPPAEHGGHVTPALRRSNCA
ncbi:MAG: hypothetical protein OXL36_10855 [Bryobacterales bacterium]|nr:hypothetical protein [Bryobacterales bacterium]MDE0295942.1 hypothetical protein [Bryobacterales bacterium]